MRYLVLSLVLWQFMAMTPVVGNDSLVVQGEYLVRAAGCVSCHTDHDNNGAYLAGGRVLATPFGKFYVPNITSDKQHGVGAWSDEDFINALQQGVSPSGDHYYPAFPYTSYTRLTTADIRAIAAYLRSVQAVARVKREHELPWYIFRWMIGFWKWLYFEPGEFKPAADKSASHNRGAYLVAIGHCTECHTPRNDIGVLDDSRFLGGVKEGPEGEAIPNITPDRQTGIGKWREGELAYFLESGELPDGDYTGSLMAEVVDDGTRYLNKSDRQAMARYLLAIPAIANPDFRKKSKKKKQIVEDEW